MSRTVEFTDTLIVVTCWCGMNHAVPEALRDYQLRSHKNGKSVTIFCPLGHGHSPSGKGEAQVEREKRERLERLLANRDEDLRAERASHTTTKGQLTKARKRAVAGVCPCCNRSFVNMRRHIETKHPGETVPAS